MLIFRTLVLIDLVIMIYSCFQEPPELTADVHPNNLALLGVILLGILVSYFISILGLLMMKNWGSQLYLIVNVVGIVISYDLYGAHALPFASPDPLISLSGAVTLAIVYISQIGQRKMFV